MTNRAAPKRRRDVGSARLFGDLKLKVYSVAGVVLASFMIVLSQFVAAIGMVERLGLQLAGCASLVLIGLTVGLEISEDD